MSAVLGRVLAKILLVLAIFAAGAGAGAYYHSEYTSGPKIATLEVSLREAQRQALLEHAARAALEQERNAGNAALSDAADTADLVRRAQQRAIQEINDATADDASGLDVLVNRMRQQRGAATGAGGDPGDAARDARP